MVIETSVLRSHDNGSWRRVLFKLRFETTTVRAPKSTKTTTLSRQYHHGAFEMSEVMLKEIANPRKKTTILPSAFASPGGGSDENPDGEGGDRSEEGGGDGSQVEVESVMENMGSEIRMKKSSFAYNMAMGLDSCVCN
ncbi:hypothetical protein L2E82_50179 [Cichorium intybus]|nr:hypothetical protein L2E82_50179 [Cichorium intybus]